VFSYIFHYGVPISNVAYRGDMVQITVILFDIKGKKSSFVNGAIQCVWVWWVALVIFLKYEH
jgi:hypothetical protein